MAHVFGFHLRIRRDGLTWYAVGSSGERHRIGDWEHLVTIVTPMLFGLVLVRVERDGERIPLEEWCD